MLKLKALKSGCNVVLAPLVISQCTNKSGYCELGVLILALLDLKTVCDELSSVEHKSHKIGVMLGLPQHKLLEFQKGDNPLPVIADFWLCGKGTGTCQED